MATVGISLATTLLIYVLYDLVEKRVIPIPVPLLCFFTLYVGLVSVLLDPISHPLIWLAFCFLLYSVLDDLVTQTLYSEGLVIAAFLFFLIGQKVDSLLFACLFFAVFLVFVKWLEKNTEETLIGEGDLYAFLALMIWLDPSQYGAFFLCSLLLVYPVATWVYVKGGISHIGFVPYIVMGACLVGEGEMILTLWPYLFGVTSLSMVIFLFFAIRKARKKRKG
ncbi:hypothetical protein IMZ31_20635 (plasmid) [Pontibacillus sp. ALD_SL1]|uniref:hypothetical protein n=1 Tax=Pontibacillus sp. ALD_SL1 TaxID=2777185 RepID=UPI001A9571F5|nr:hypothetical protein [Pontibacillus sp. ALD_SL1]QST02957.1 hypothetical protein IMZ31_20635 [Pontibacillus sp. ALD_SL1]